VTPSPIDPASPAVPVVNYEALPISKRYANMEITLIGISRKDPFGPFSSFNITIKNLGDNPLQVDQVKTTGKAGDLALHVSSQMYGFLSDVLYKTVTKDQQISGNLVLTPLPDSAKEVTIYVTVIENDLKQTRHIVEFNARID